MTDEKIEDRSGEMEEDLHALEDHIADAEKQLEARKDDAEVLDGPADEEGREEDRAGGDPEARAGS